ncbi:hypothetical protein BLA34_12730 [Ralstonia solanacearum]|nr:hypothetical protein BLA34_12730 [Ralstonia solanacearum]
MATNSQFPPNRTIMHSTEEIGGKAGATVPVTHTSDTQRIGLVVPPEKVIPVIFLPGVMGSNLRMSKAQQKKMGKKDNVAWRPDRLGPTELFGEVADAAGATPAERQLKFDPDETEVDRYEITEEIDPATGQNKFDLTGNETETSDKRHGSVPNDLPNIGLLMSAPVPMPGQKMLAKTNKRASSAAQKARWRGWSEVFFDSYSRVLKTLEANLNDLQPPYRRRVPYSVPPAEALFVNSTKPSEWGGSGEPLTEQDVQRVANCWYPVYAIGYNWLQSNGTSAKKVAERINEIIETYKQNGRKCEKVIIVTHSMGGLVTRALIHPKYGNLKDKVLGVYHSVMPTHGSAAAYKRVRCGFDVGPYTPRFLAIPQKVMGGRGQDVTVVFANASGPLELLPNTTYGTQWLKVQDEQGNTLAQWPQTDALPEIYALADPNAWWGLINQEWINPANKQYDDTTPYITYKTRVKDAQRFHADIKDTFHDNTYASYGDDPNRKTFGEVTWRMEPSKGSFSGAVGLDSIGVLGALGSPSSWTRVSEDGIGALTVKAAGGQNIKLKLLPAAEAGDETVPSERSAELVQAKMRFRQTGYEHQGSYENDNVLDAALYSIIKIANTAGWWEGKA